MSNKSPISVSNSKAMQITQEAGANDDNEDDSGDDEDNEYEMPNDEADSAKDLGRAIKDRT